VRKSVVDVATGEIAHREILVNLPIGQRYFDFTMRPLRDDSGNRHRHRSRSR
jgi:hypothetical protein